MPSPETMEETYCAPVLADFRSSHESKVKEKGSQPVQLILVCELPQAIVLSLVRVFQNVTHSVHVCERDQSQHHSWRKNKLKKIHFPCRQKTCGLGKASLTCRRKLEVRWTCIIDLIPRFSFSRLVPTNVSAASSTTTMASTTSSTPYNI